MIIFRYLTREVFTTLISVTFVLLFIFISNQFVRYLGDAAAGKLIGTVLLRLMMLQIPYLLGLLLPLGLFLGILLSLGRLYADNELATLISCGMSPRRLIFMIFKMALIMALLVSFLTLWLGPRLLLHRDQIMLESDNASVLQTLMPGRFQASQGGRQVYFVENMSRDRQHLDNIFVAQTTDENSNPPAWTVVSAAGGYQFKDKKTQDQFLVATDGYRYQGVPGAPDYHIAKFGKYGIRILEHEVFPRDEIETLSLSQLWHQLTPKNPLAYSEFEWRFAMPLATLLLALLAIPLSEVKPRQGKYAKLLPSLLIFTVYANMLFVARNWVEKGVMAPFPGIWLIHFSLAFLIGIVYWFHFKRVRG